MTIEVPGSPVCDRCGGYVYLWQRFRGQSECPACREQRYAIRIRGTFTAMAAELLAERSADWGADYLAGHGEALDPKTLALARAVVDAKRAGADWEPAADKLRRRGRQLEERAYRRPRARAHLRAIWGGRRWRVR